MTFLSQLFSFGGETRSASLENPSVSLTDAKAWATVFGPASNNFAGEPVTVESVMGIPAAWAAIDVIATSIASLPIGVYRKLPNGERERVSDSDPLQSILNDQVNDDFLTSSEFRRWLIVQYLTRGRALAWIERNRAGRVTNLWPLDLDAIEIKITGHRRSYVEKTQAGRSARQWDASEVIDLIWLPGSAPGSHLDPLRVHANTFGAAIAADRYAARAFRNGGVPPLKLKSPDGMSPEALGRATAGVTAALKNGGLVLPLFPGMDLDAIGFEPAKMQLLDLKRQHAVEISRIFRLPPTVIQSLEFGTYSNTEQLGLHFVRHTIQPIVEQFEEEFLAKLFGRGNRTNFVKFNIDGLQRGDIATRFDAFAKAIQGGFMTPNEVRALDDRAPLPGGDQLLIQGATIPLDMAGKLTDQTTQSPTDTGQKAQ